MSTRLQRLQPVTTGRLLEVELFKLTFRSATARVDSLEARVRPAPQWRQIKIFADGMGSLSQLVHRFGGELLG
jgi:hypothetical protein